MVVQSCYYGRFRYYLYSMAPPAAMVKKMEDDDWDELPADVQEAATKLGYNKKLWDKDKTPEICDKYWKDLTAEQQAAAEILGYSVDNWDDSDSD